MYKPLIPRGRLSVGWSTHDPSPTPPYMLAAGLRWFWKCIQTYTDVVYITWRWVHSPRWRGSLTDVVMTCVAAAEQTQVMWQERLLQHDSFTHWQCIQSATTLYSADLTCPSKNFTERLVVFALRADLFGCCLFSCCRARLQTNQRDFASLCQASTHSNAP